MSLWGALSRTDDLGKGGRSPQPRNGSTRTWDIALTTSDLAVKCNVVHQPRTSLMAAAVKLASSSVSDSVMIRGGPSSTMSPSRPSAHPVEE